MNTKKKQKTITKNIYKVGDSYYSRFRDNSGKLVRKSLGNDLPQAKIVLAQLQAGIDTQSLETDRQMDSLSGKGKSFKSALNEFINHAYGIEDAWTKKHFDQRTERQGQMVMNLLKKHAYHANISNVNQARLPQMMPM